MDVYEEERLERPMEHAHEGHSDPDRSRLESEPARRDWGGEEQGDEGVERGGERDEDAVVDERDDEETRPMEAALLWRGWV